MSMLRSKNPEQEQGLCWKLQGTDVENLPVSICLGKLNTAEEKLTYTRVFIHQI